MSEQGVPQPAPRSGAAASALTSGHLIGAVGVVSLCISAYMFGALQRSKTELGAEVERSVRTGIQQGAEEVLAPEKIEDRSAAVGRGLVGGVIDGVIDEATDKATDPETKRLGREAAQAMFQEADAVAGVGLDLLGAALAPPPPQENRDAKAPNETAENPSCDEPSPFEANDRKRSLAEDAGEVAVETVDLGFDVLDAMLRPPPPSADDQASDRVDDER